MKMFEEAYKARRLCTNLSAYKHHLEREEDKHSNIKYLLEPSPSFHFKSSKTRLCPLAGDMLAHTTSHAASFMSISILFLIHPVLNGSTAIN